MSKNKKELKYSLVIACRILKYSKNHLFLCNVWLNFRNQKMGPADQLGAVSTWLHIKLVHRLGAISPWCTSSWCIDLVHIDLVQKNMFLCTNLICTKSMRTKSILHQVEILPHKICKNLECEMWIGKIGLENKGFLNRKNTLRKNIVTL